MNSDSDLNILERMLGGLGVETPHVVAVRLLERFGGFSGVFAATEAELEEVGLSSRAAAFFAFVNPALRRVTTGDRSNECIVDERTTVKSALTLIGRQNKHGYYAVYTDGAGRRIFAEFLGEESTVSAAAVGACRHKTKKLLLARICADGEVNGIKENRVGELVELMRLLEILEIEFIDYVETDGVEFFSLRRAIELGDGTASVFDASEKQFEKVDFHKMLANRKQSGRS